MPDDKDPWAALAESLGAAANREPTPPPPPCPPAKPREEPRPAESRPVNQRSAQGWDDLEASLGLPSARGSNQPAVHRQGDAHPAAEPRESAQSRLTAEPPQSRESRRVDRPSHPPHDEFEDDGPRRGQRPDGDAHTGRTDSGDASGDAPRRDDGEPRGHGAEPGGEGRPRRRGRRGGRGRGRSRRERDATTVHGSAGDSRGLSGGDVDSEPLDDLRAERAAPAGDAAEKPLDAEERPRRRRRRRGRRGGSSAGADSPRRSEPRDELPDEPLPAGYGRPLPGRQPKSPESDGRDAVGERRRRRRRRGGGDDADRQPTADAGSQSAPRRGRRRRRGGDRDRVEGQRSSSSRLARRSRDDFAPVSRGDDDHDEGLEFLGVEEAAHDQPGREPRRVSDDVIAESGLDAVRDVPSWVEAIGIVIAGNLDARSRPRSDRGEEDRRRR